ncbi:MAG: MFS transporter [Candidatus Aenigmatarchaeota archaeon]|nr:MAG: MFS transporter [Candidatus Aenigmarchaeota archaeon]
MENDNFKKALILLFPISLFWNFMFAVVPIYLSEIGFSGYEIGILAAIYAISSIFVSFPTGFVNDRWTIRLTLVIGIIFISSFFLGIGFLESFVIFMPLYFLGGLGYNMGLVSIRTLVYKTRMEGREGNKFGIYNFVNTTAASIGLVIGGLLILILEFSLALKVIGIIYLLLIPLVSFRPITKYRVKLSEYKKDFLDRKVILLGIIIFIFTLHWGAEATSFGLFLRNNLGLDMFLIGLYTGISLFSLGLTAYFFGKRIDRGKSNMKNVFIAGMIISGVFHILHTVPIPWLSFILRIPHEIGDGMTLIAIYFWVSKLFGVKRIGGDSSIMFTVTLLGHVVGSLIFGPIGYHLGYHIPLIISGVTNILSAFLLIAFVKAFKVRETY